MKAVNYPLADPSASVPPARRASLLARLLRFSACLLGAAGLFVAYEHFKLNGQSTPSLLSLVGAAGLALGARAGNSARGIRGGAQGCCTSFMYWAVWRLLRYR